MKIVYQQRISKADIQSNPDILYVFGDNLDRIGRGGQAKEMRDAGPNVFGLATKKGTYTRFTDDDLSLLNAEIDRFFTWLGDVTPSVLVWPLDGIGTGLAALKESAPACWELLNRRLAERGIVNDRKKA